MADKRKSYHLIFTSIKNGEINLNRLTVHTDNVNNLGKDFFGKNEPFTNYKIIELDK